MNKRLLLLWISALFLLAGTALAACGDDDDDDGGGGGTDTTAAAEFDTLKPGTLLVGVDVPYPPFEQGRPPDYEGFEIDMMNEIASRLGLEIGVQGHAVRHDLPRPRAGQVRLPRSVERRSPTSANRRSTSLTRGS